MKDTNHAILLMHCQDQKGIVASVTDFLVKNNGNILSLDQHVDDEEKRFFMRVEWDLDGFTIPQEKIADFFDTLIASRFDMEWQIKVGNQIPRMAIFVSKYAHCFFDVLSRYESREWDVDIPLIISNHDKFEHIAERYKIPFYHLPITKANKAEQEQKQLEILKEHKIDFIILARYMQIVTSTVIDQYPNQIINIHHSSLPAFAGANPYGAAFKRGVKFMGATAHYVTEELDAGPIIKQDVISISHLDSISDMKRKGKDIEKIVFANAIYAHMNFKILTYKNKTVIFE